jgi:sigma-B regulation protein RsbU (phosphoserine phosphatase)
LWGHFASALSRDRILLWFGLFAAPYGVALLSRTLILSGPDQQSAWWMAILGRMVGLGAIVPALLLFREFYGNGWRFSSGFLLWIYVVLSAGVVILATVEERPRSIPSPGLILIILVPFLLAVDRFAGYRPPAMPHRSVIYTGLVIFFLAFSYDHLAHWRAHSMTTSTEPIGFIVLVVCLGYVVSQRVAIAEAEWRTMGDEMRVARRIQAAILPASMPAVPGYSVAARYCPMTAVAGDFYCFPSQKPDDFAIVLADVMGHGVPAALVASMIKVAVYAGIENGTSPGQTVTHLNSTLCKQAPGQLTSAVAVSLSRASGAGRYCAAGHPPPLLWHRRSRQLERLEAAGLLLGVHDGERFEETEFRCETGDRLLIYSDGLTEAEDRNGVEFGDTKLAEVMQIMESVPTEAFAGRMLSEALQWSGVGGDRSQSDDITLIVVDLT